MNMQHMTFDGYSYFNYALLHGTGFTHVLDTMRYERAFFARSADVAHIVEAASENYAEWAMRPYTILLGKYDSRGKTKPGWTPQRLLSNQDLEIISDPLQLMQLSADHFDLKPPKKLKVQHMIELEGKVEWILRVMHQNKAMPLSENDALALERALRHNEPVVKLTLTNFCVYKTLWTFPAKE